MDWANQGFQEAQQRQIRSSQCNGSNLDFDSKSPEPLSLTVHLKEWAKLAELNALEEVGKANIVALKSSNMNYFTPKAFCVLFTGVFAALIL